MATLRWWLTPRPKLTEDHPFSNSYSNAYKSPPSCLHPFLSPPHPLIAGGAEVSSRRRSNTLANMQGGTGSHPSWRHSTTNLVFGLGPGKGRAGFNRVVFVLAQTRRGPRNQ
ncbi:hypothetical protein BXZ70DRAFT_1010182 [Cristinia sonorae]|uniref:Uncharacterized protein n=1 Tax=Cristinia sonorae TaxID=1940300 RepID=A0A8K0UK27_9AGAR|nr:hypothetical protein BXZ70DRAFT_1010182 [Cristinia sonorae]